MVFAVRKGNPKNIRTWDDLVKDDVEVITPNPFTSGGAQWNIGAAYGAQLEQGKTKQEALEYLQRLFENVPVQPKGARESLQVFTAGKGDVLSPTRTRPSPRSRPASRSTTSSPTRRS